MKRIFQPLKDLKERKSVIAEAKEWCLSENKNEDMIIPGVKMMHSYKSILCRMIENLSEMHEKQDNSAILLLAALLDATMRITSQENEDYTWKAVEQMGNICAEIVKDTGSLSEQFLIMAQLPREGPTQKEE